MSSGPIAPGGLPEDHAHAPAVKSATNPPPLGVVLSVVIAAMVVGAASAKLLHDAASSRAWLMAIALCGVLFGLARSLDCSTPTRSRILVVIALGFLAFGYLIVLGGESMPRPASRRGLGFVTAVFLLLAVLAVAVILPVAIVATALRRGRGSAFPRVGLDFAPQLIVASLGLAAMLLSVAFLAVTIWTSPPQWRLVAAFVVALGLPAVLLPFWTHIYERLLSRWRVTPPPQPLLDGLETLRRRIGFGFDRILCLQARFGAGRVCQVIAGHGHSTLVVSESIPGELTTDQLLAVLAHEAAHVRLNHLRRKVAWGALGAVVGLTTAVVAQILIAPLMPRPLRFAGVLVVVLAIVALRGLYDAFVMRRHEAEADEFAVDVAGATALVDALGALGVCGPPEALMRNRWTTHSTWERRLSRIRECEKSRGYGR
jgi:Zn-dependent protease with chaperone function